MALQFDIKPTEETLKLFKRIQSGDYKPKTDIEVFDELCERIKRQMYKDGTNSNRS